MTTAWIRNEDRKRSLLATGLTACLYALALGAALVLSLLAPLKLSTEPNTVVINIAGNGGAAGEIPLGLPSAPERPANAPLGAAPLPAQGGGGGTAASSSPAAASASSAAALPKPLPGAKTIPEAAKPLSKAEAAAQAAAAARQAEEDAAVRAAEATAQAASSPAKTRTFGSASAAGSALGSSQGTGQAAGVAGGTGSVTFRGSEMGNSYATTFGASGGQVGQNIFVPIYYYMPLPHRISGAVYDKITYKSTFRSIYQESGTDWVLKEQPAIPQRSNFWNMLEEAGYDASTADYKTSQKLSPVVLEFAVGPVQNNNVELVDVRVSSSSGSPDVDEAVVFGFKQATFFNKTPYAIGGKFVYGF